jgi:putative transcriptional regulator
MLLPSNYSSAPGLTGTRRAIASFLIVGFLAVLYAPPVLAEVEFMPSSVGKGVLLVASPSLDDPNFRQAVVLVVEHGSGGTVGLILNRSTNVLLSKALPDITALKGTSYRLFAGGPVEPHRLLLLFRLKEPPADARVVFDGVYLGRTPGVLEGIIPRSKPTEAFRAFAGFAAWAPRQLEAEMLLGAWAILPPDSSSIFDKDPATLWQDCMSRLQGPRVIGAVWSIPRARGTEEGMEPMIFCARATRGLPSTQLGTLSLSKGRRPSLDALSCESATLPTI